MNTPGQQNFIEDCLVNFEDGGGGVDYGYPAEADDENSYYAPYPALNAWDTPQGLTSGGGYVDPYGQPLLDYDNKPETETTTPDTRTSGQASASDGWSMNAPRSKSKSSKSSAPSTESGSSSKHRKVKHQSSTATPHQSSGKVSSSQHASSSKDKEKSISSSSKEKSGKEKSSKEKASKEKGSGKEKGSSKEKAGRAKGPSGGSGSRGGGGSSSHHNDDALMGEDHPDKRDKFLERNRIAASKCREKKKAWVTDLEDQKLGLESQNSHLQMEYNDLLGEVSRMKNQIMSHAACNDSNIDKWIENEARRFVQAQSDRYDRDQHPFAPPPSAGMYSAQSAATASYAASSSYQNDDVASQMSPTDLGGFDGGSPYGDAPAADKRHRPGHGQRKGSGHR